MTKRKCVGCGELKEVNKLIKITHDITHNNVVINHNNKIFGRSAYICYNNSCIEAAFKKNKISKALKANVPENLKGRLINEF